MDNAHSEIENKAILWAKKGMGLGWISEKQADTFNLLHKNTPSFFFKQGNHRPMVIAFFGGTGVGKSTLLNRLANHSVVQAGIKRPTSMQTTIYHHHTVQLNLVSQEDSLDTIKTISHSNTHFKGTVLIDMLDVDSVEKANSQQTIDLLPYIDILIYVVNPDRYYDNKAWHILRNEGKFHTCIFIMNQWDRGVEVQFNDFKQQLKNKAGFKNPLIFRTDCRTYKTSVNVDEFDQFKNTILSLQNQHIIDQFEYQKYVLRINSIHECIKNTLTTLGNNKVLARILNEWEIIWKEQQFFLIKDMEQPIREISQLFAQQDSNSKKSYHRVNIETPTLNQEYDQHKNLKIWNQQAKTHLSNAFKQFFVEIDAIHIPTKPFQIALENKLNLASELINVQAEENLLSSLVKLSSLAKRTFFKLAGNSELLLPLTSLNTEKEALRGLYKGVEKGINALNEEIYKCIEATVISKTDYVDEGRLLCHLCTDKIPFRKDLGTVLLSRALIQ